MYSRVIVEPPVEPLTLAEAKLQVAIDHDLHDDMLAGLITEARQYVEKFCQLSLVTQTRQTYFDAFAPWLELPYGPVQEVLAVEYVDGTGVLTAITDYQSDLNAPLARIAPGYGAVWPTPRAVFNAVSVSYVAGYTPVAGSPTDYVSSIPGPLKRAMKLLISNWYENREASVTGLTNTALELGVDALLRGYRIRLGMA